MRRIGSRVFLLAVFWLAAASWSSAQIPLSNSSGNETYKLHGEVLNSITGEGIPYALVTVSSENKQALLTGPDGRFEFAGLSAGRVSVTVSKPGFFEDGERKITVSDRMGAIFASARSNGRYAINGLGASVQIGPDTAPVVFKLAPEGIITGHVEDSHGEPIERAFVRVEAAQILDGRKRWTQIAGTTSREDGAFRIANLHPGRYYVSVHSLTRGRTLEDVNAANPMGYPLNVYYPASPDRVSAAPVEIAAGQRVEIQFALGLQPVFKVSGEVSGWTKGQGVNIRLLSLSGEDLGLPGRFYPDGRFEIQGVPAGNYRLEARGENVGELPLHVSGNLNGIHLSLRPRISIPVIIRSQATRTPEMKADNSGVHRVPPINLVVHRTDFEGEYRSASIEQHHEDSPPSLEVGPGRYSVDLSASYNGVYVQSARYGDIDLLREELIVQPAAAPRPIEVVLRDDSASLQIKIMRPERDLMCAVLIVPETAPGQVKVLNVGGDSENFVMGFISGLAPGDYKVFAFDSLLSIEFRNPEVMKQYSASAAQVSLTAGMTSNVSVEMIHTR